MKNKKGSHVGVIISFTVFILFVMFMYAIMLPSIQQKKEKQYVTDYVKNYLTEHASANLTSATVNFSSDYAPAASCVSVAQPVDSAGMNLVVKNSLNEETPFEDDSSNVEISWTGSRFFRFYYAPESFDVLEISLSECESAEENSDYEIGQVKKNSYIFESKIEDLISEYETFRESVSSEAGGDFGFSFFNDEKEEIHSTGEPDVSTSIYYESVPIQYVDEKANLKQGYLVIKTW